MKYTPLESANNAPSRNYILKTDLLCIKMDNSIELSKAQANIEISGVIDYNEWLIEINEAEQIIEGQTEEEYKRIKVFNFYLTPIEHEEKNYS